MITLWAVDEGVDTVRCHVGRRLYGLGWPRPLRGGATPTHARCTQSGRSASLSIHRLARHAAETHASRGVCRFGAEHRGGRRLRWGLDALGVVLHGIGRSGGSAELFLGTLARQLGAAPQAE